VKTSVSLQELLEVEIKPGALLDDYSELVQSEIPRYFPREARREAAAPCEGGSTAPAFEKWGFTYRECLESGSLFVSPRPDEATLVRYYRESEAARFWRDRVLSATEEARTEKLYAPRVDWVVGGVVESAPTGVRSLLDLSFGGHGFPERLLQSRIGLERVIAASAVADLDHPDQVSGLEVRPGTLSEAIRHGPVDVATAFDALDRAADVHAFEAAVHQALRPGGLLFLSAPTSSGFEIQLLWERSRTLLPPDKLNVLSVEALQSLFSEERWELIELSTPGVLDVEVVRSGMAQYPEIEWPRFLRYLLHRRDEAARIALQQYLQRFRLASFARLLVRKRG
jgi:hypothetical protein